MSKTKVFTDLRDADELMQAYKDVAATFKTSDGLDNNSVEMNTMGRKVHEVCLRSRF